MLSDGGGDTPRCGRRRLGGFRLGRGIINRGGHRAPRPARYGHLDEQHAALDHGLRGHVLRALV